MLRLTDKYGDSVLMAAAKGGGGHEMFAAVLRHLRRMLTKDEVGASLGYQDEKWSLIAISLLGNDTNYLSLWHILVSSRRLHAPAGHASHRVKSPPTPPRRDEDSATCSTCFLVVFDPALSHSLIRLFSSCCRPTNMDARCCLRLCTPVAESPSKKF